MAYASSPWPRKRSAAPPPRHASWSARSPSVTLTSTSDPEDRISTRSISAFPSRSKEALGSSWLPANAIACECAGWSLVSQLTPTTISKPTSKIRASKKRKYFVSFYLGFLFSCSWWFSFILYISCQKKYEFWSIFSWVVLKLITIFCQTNSRAFW
jgi:hypothetical protein